MPQSIEIPDEMIKGFNDHAKKELSRVVTEYVSDLVYEVNRLESPKRTSRDAIEVTSAIVYDANIVVRRNLSKPHKSFVSKLLKLGSVLLAFLAGKLLDQSKIQSDSGYLIFYILFISVTVIVITINTLKED